MSGVLFLQSDAPDPYTMYAARLRQGAVHYDREAGLWAVYSHAGCRTVLTSAHAHVPGSALDGLEDEAALIGRHLVRLANPPDHALLRETARQLFERLDGSAVAGLVGRLLPGQGVAFDWVETVCKPLPPLALMHGLGFADASIDMLLPHMGSLAKLMLPAKPAPLQAEVRQAASACWPALQTEAMRIAGTRDVAAAANLAGLLIQSLDATRGLLSNALLAALALPAPPSSPRDWHLLVQETLRWNPPIQNTRRVLAERMEIDGVTLASGDQVLLVLASANRDPAVFPRPDRFDTGRENSAEHLTFGFGAHACLAREYAVRLASQALARLFASGPVGLPRQIIAHAPMINARLPEHVRIRIDRA